MCGINGITWNDSELIKKMNEKIRHRGPDDEGIYTDQQVSLGHIRLAIIDLSPTGHQPMFNEDKSIIIIYNGEIYNYKEIREELEESGHKFQSNSDTEVIIHSYEQWSYECLNHFNGMFAFCIYDKNKNLIFLARDRFGIKPLYYYCENYNLIFSSEIKAILQTNILIEPNDSVISDYLNNFWIDVSSETFFKGIFKIMPGEYAIFNLSDRSFKKFKWYNLLEKIKSNCEKFKNITEEEAIKEFDFLIRDSLRYRLIADVPVAAALSGGLDSSTLVCYLKNIHSNYENLSTFSIILPGKEMDESKYMNEVINFANVKSFKEVPTVEELINDLDDFIYTMEEPFQSFSMYGSYRLCKLANQKGFKVILNGQGMDEMLAGYSHYFPLYFITNLKKLKLGEAFHTLKWTIKRRIFKEYINSIIRSKIFKDSCFYKLGTQKNKFEDFPKNSLNNLLLRDFLIFILPSLLRYDDHNSMRWHVESRVPFLDYRIVEFLLSLPEHYKINKGINKYILRKTIQGKVPQMIINRMDKIGFQLPDKDWLLSDEFQNYIKSTLESESFKNMKYWDYKKFIKIYKKFKSGKLYLFSKIWRALNVHNWIKIYIDKN